MMGISKPEPFKAMIDRGMPNVGAPGAAFPPSSDTDSKASLRKKKKRGSMWKPYFAETRKPLSEEVIELLVDCDLLDLEEMEVSNCYYYLYKGYNVIKSLHSYFN